MEKNYLSQDDTAKIKNEILEYINQVQGFEEPEKHLVEEHIDGDISDGHPKVGSFKSTATMKVNYTNEYWDEYTRKQSEFWTHIFLEYILRWTVGNLDGIEINTNEYYVNSVRMSTPK